MRFASLCAAGLFCVTSIAGAQPAAARNDLLVTPAWLASHINDANLVILHVGQRENFAAKHIPGARFVEIADVSVSDFSAMIRPAGMGPPPPQPLTGPKNGLSTEMPTAEQLRGQLEKFGISDNSRIVIYQADQYYSPSTRILFTLDHAGLGSRTSVLDGGLRAWIADTHEVTDAVPPVKPGKLSALSLRPTIVNVDYVKSHANAPHVSIVDARAASFYDGVPVSSSRGNSGPPAPLGHIAGAKSLPFGDMFADDEKLKSVDALSALFKAAGVQPGDTVVAYCHVGQQATATIFAARVLGHPVLLYDGSMNEWNKLGLPLELPPAKKP